MKISVLALVISLTNAPFALAETVMTVTIEENQSLRGRKLSEWRSLGNTANDKKQGLSGNKPDDDTCNRKKDCKNGFYCSSGGKCLEHGDCLNLSDCENPQNEFSIIDCVGELQCMDDGTCGKICEPDVLPDQCGSDADCGEGFYCAGGCRAYGECGNNADCMNPSNQYAVIECFGYVECDVEAGICTKACSDNPCPNGEPQVRCFAQPCSLLSESCDEDWVTCVDDYCGGCNAIAFNAAGQQVCNEEPDQLESTACTSDTDCGSEQYCSAGVCRNFGDCGNDVDCFNPANEYATIFCVGPIYCEEGRCGRVCDSSPCPKGEEYVNCVVSPCSVIESSCDADYVSCTDYYCGGCKALAFDAAGNQVCEN